MGEHFVFVNDIKLHVLVEGDGPPLLLLHGFPDSLHLWRHQIPILLDAGYKVIAPDQRGFGRSGAPQGRDNYTSEKIVADAIALLNVFGVREKVRVIGHDWGAVIGWQLVIHHAERVGRFVALSVGHPNGYHSAGLEQAVRGLYMFFFNIPGWSEKLLQANNWALFRRFAKGYPESERWIADLSRPGRLTAALNWYRANIPQMIKQDHAHAQLPVMGIWSTRDSALTESQMLNSERWVDDVWRYERIKRASHWLMLDRPHELNALLLDWLA